MGIHTLKSAKLTVNELTDSKRFQKTFERFAKTFERLEQKKFSGKSQKF